MVLGGDHLQLVVLDGVKLLLLDPVVLEAHNFVLMDLFVDNHHRADVVTLVMNDQLVLGHVEAKSQPLLDAYNHHSHRNGGERHFTY